MSVVVLCARRCILHPTRTVRLQTSFVKAHPWRASAFATKSNAVVTPDATVIRALGVSDVTEFVLKLGISEKYAKMLEKEEVDGPALLAMTEDKLRRCGLPFGPAGLIMRATAVAAAEAQSVTLTFYAPKKKPKDPNNALKVKLTPAQFERMFDLLQSPLRIVNASGSVLRFASSLAEAAEASRNGMRLVASRRYDEDLASLNNFQANSATAFEVESTRALAGDAGLCSMYGALELVNSGEEVTLRLSRPKRPSLELVPDGLVVSPLLPVVLFNSAKLTPSEEHIDELLLDVVTLELMLTDWVNVTTDPPEAKAQLRGILRVVPFLSGNNFSAATEAACAKKGVGVVRPSGEGFVVKAASILASGATSVSQQ